MKNKKRYLFIFILIFSGINIVNAETTAKLTYSNNVITYSYDTGKIGSGSGGAIYNKKLGNATAYCSSLHWQVPSSGATYKIASGTSNYNKDNYIAGQIIKIGKKKYSGKTQYMYIQEALNCYFSNKYGESTFKTGDSNTYNFCKKNSAVTSLIKTAKNYVNEYQFTEGSKTSSLPKITLTASNKLLSKVTMMSNGSYNYESSTITISGLSSEKYGGDRSDYGYTSTAPSYTLNITGNVSGSTVSLCSATKCYSNGATDIVDGNYTLKVVNGGTNGGNISISIEGKNQSKYPSANIWKCKSGCVSKSQVLQTAVSSVDVTRTTSVNQNFTYSSIGKYSVLIEKVDESGKALANSTLKLYIADANGNKLGSDLCTTSNGETSCSKNDLSEYENYKTGNQLCYTEEKSPSGYKNIGTHCYPISLTGNDANVTKYYEYHKENDKWIESEITTNGEAIYKNYQKFSKESSSSVNVFTGSNNKKIYSAAEAIYEYKYITNEGERTFYSTSSISDESSGVYQHGERTEKEDGTYEYEYNDPIYMVAIPTSIKDTSSANGLETNLVNTPAYVKDGKYVILTSTSDEDDGIPIYSEKDPSESIVLVNTYTASNNKVCWNDTEGVASDSDKYCSEDYYISQVEVSNGSFHITVVNVLNSIKISKKVVNGTDELPGATLALYTASNGKCSDTLVSKNTSSALVFSYKAYTPIPFVDESANDKEDTSSDNTTDNDDNGEDAVDDSAIDESYNYLEGLKWKSTDEPVTISGLAPGEYCLSEISPASGYKKTTSVSKFTINSNGEVDTESVVGEYKDNTFVLRNELNKITISKTDVATSKELPGATIRICDAVKNEDGTYSPVVSTGETGNDLSDLTSCDMPTLTDGSDATWVSGEEPHEVVGLPTGTYALVEITAPNGYEVAETIFFKMTDAGVLTDVNDNTLENNKITMTDDPIKEVKTGDKYLIIIGLITITCLVVGVYSYKNTNKKFNKKQMKFRKRKIYKNM